MKEKSLPEIIHFSQDGTYVCMGLTDITPTIENGGGITSTTGFLHHFQQVSKEVSILNSSVDETVS